MRHGVAEGADPALHGAALRTWGTALTELGRLIEAEEALLEAYDLQSAELGPAHPHTQRDVEALVTLYERWDRPEAAAEWRGRRSG